MTYRRTDSVEARLASPRLAGNRNRNRNRNRILLAARTLVSEGGWPEAQVSHVAAATGVATGTVYRYFPSKAHLCVEVLSTVSQREVDVLEAIASGSEAPAPRLHACSHHRFRGAGHAQPAAGLCTDCRAMRTRD